MGIDKLIATAVTAALIAVSSGRLPRILNSVHVVQTHLIQRSRTSTWGRPMLLPKVREGRVEKVIVYSFSRFARSVTHLLNALEDFCNHDTAFISYAEQVDTNSPIGRAVFTVIAAISQLERELIIERVKNGLKNAKMKGKHIGRVKTRPSELIRALLKSGMTLREAAKVARCSHGSISLEKKLMKQEEAAQAAAALERELELFEEKQKRGGDAALPQAPVFALHIS